MASLLLPKSMSMPTMEASEEMLEVRLLLVAVSGASITDVLYSLGVPKAMARPMTAKTPMTTAIMSLSALMALSRAMMSISILLLMADAIF